jgi:hypothetical protein
MADLTEEQFEAARTRGEARMRGPRAVSVHYDAGRNRIIVRLTTGVEIGFAPRDMEGLEPASLDDLKRIEVEPFGLGIHFPTIDADLYVPALLEGNLGSARWMAARLAGTVAKAGAPRDTVRRGGGRTKAAIGGGR